SSSCDESTTTGTLGARSRILRKVSAPRLSGRFRSSSTSEGGSRSSEASASESRGTQSTFNPGWLSSRRRRTRSTSPGLSSISRMRVGWSVITLPSRQYRVSEPELFNGAHRREKSFKVSGLGDAAIGARFITAGDIRGGSGAAERHHRNLPQLGVGLHQRQHFVTVALGQIQIENHQIRPDRSSVLAPLVQILEGVIRIRGGVH